MKAVWAGHTGVAAILLEAGADPEIEDAIGRRAVRCAGRCSEEEILLRTSRNRARPGPPDGVVSFPTVGFGCGSKTGRAVSAGWFLGREGIASRGSYQEAFGLLAQAEFGRRARRLAAGALWIVRHRGGVFALGTTLAHVSLSEDRVDGVHRASLIGPEFQAVLGGWRFRIGWLSEVSARGKGMPSQSGFVWSVGIGL